MQRFLFLELLDPEIHALLNGLRAEFGGRPSDANVHLTVRGPYKSGISLKAINNFESILREYPMLIHGVGIFDQSNEYVVYLKVENPNLRKIWWKPDYPVARYGFNPHISLYKGRDKLVARCVFEFLRNEDLKLLCGDFRLTTYVSKQKDFLPADWLPTGRHFLQLANRGLVKADVLQRAHDAIRRCKLPSSEKPNISSPCTGSSGE